MDAVNARTGMPSMRRSSIYEVHAASWFHPEGRIPTWDELTARLVPYVSEMGFTPYRADAGRGTSVRRLLGLSAARSVRAECAGSARPTGFARFVDACHRANIGVIVDWVPGHFPTDAHGLARFDGTALYEHQDPREGFHRDWNTYIYNFGRREVQGFLIASGLYWLEHFHVDGLRVDAVASMLYRDYTRPAGRVDPQRLRRPRKPGGNRLLAPLQRRRRRALRRRDHDCRGVDRLARRVAADQRRRPGIRLQMEHGLDARHAPLHGARSDPPRHGTTTT